jgi:hypothetical protein
MSTTVVLPLSGIDHSAVSTATVTYGYVVEGVDEARLTSAASRVVEKWRLLAGRLEWNPDSKRYHIRTIPTPHSLPDNHARVTFTFTYLPTVSLGPYISEQTSDTISVLTTPPISHFRDSSTPNSLSQYASRNLPLISIHVSRFADGACIGIVFPHGVFDAIGMGMFVKFLDAEIHGKEWNPPALRTVNMLERALSDIRESPPMDHSLGLAHVQRNYSGLGVTSIVSLLASLLYENYWHKTEQRVLYIGGNIVKQIVDKVKEEVTAQGKGWVSTGDILLAWFLKVSQYASFVCRQH